jgi:hypothetical protein
MAVLNYPHWETIKRFFVTQVRHLGYKWFEA